MSDRGRGILDEELAALLDGEPADRPGDFDEATYLRLHPDVAAAVASGVYASGFDHYTRYGAKENRAYKPEAAPVAPAGPPPAMPPHSLDTLQIASGGSIFLVGWLDDSADPLAHMFLIGDGWSVDLAQGCIARVRRQDVEAALNSDQRHLYGFWCLADLARQMPRQGPCRVRFILRSGAENTVEIEPRNTRDFELRDVALGYLADAQFFGNPHVGGIASLDGGVGARIVDFNCRLTRSVVASPYVEVFGPANRKFKGSIIVCLYGKPEYLFLQNALFAGRPGIEDYEFIFVCNSPELGERLLRDAKISSFVHGLRQTIVLLPANAGFGGANNVASRFASSDRVMAVNPDVFPVHQDWAKRHTDVVENLPDGQSRIFGIPLYYDDGSLMHGGMYFDMDSALVAEPSGMSRRDLVRVEHYGKGAPPNTAAFVGSRPVTAVTGAFISCRRDWFERLGGFTEDFVFGHYEDADLCVKSLELGYPSWLHDIRMWHLEGKGSTRLRVHEGGSIVNRWLFSTRWAQRLVNSGLIGQKPTHPLLQPPLPGEIVSFSPSVVPSPVMAEPEREPAAETAEPDAAADTAAPVADDDQPRISSAA